MKTILAVILLLMGGHVAAGDYYGSGRIDTYDSSTGLYFRAVENLPKKRGILGSVSSNFETINISVFDPASGTTKLIFKDPIVGHIVDVVFESSFKDGVIEFNGYGTRYIKNNTLVTKREPRNKLLILVRKAERTETELLVSDKRGGGVSTVAVVPDGVDWHIDVRNSKIRVVRQVGEAIRIESYEW